MARSSQAAPRRERWALDGHEVQITSLDKLFWPDAGLTKGDLLRYYREIAPVLLPAMEDRPFIMRAWPDGIGGKNYYRWRVPAHAPDWLERFDYALQMTNRRAEMAVVDDLAELIWVVNQGVIEMHPWVATRHDPDRPTWLFFDLDPVEEIDFGHLLQIGLWIHEMLTAVGLAAVAKTSGGDGLHIFVPLAPGPTFAEVRGWLSAFIEWLEARHPGTVTADKRLTERRGKVLIDYSQNAIGKSIVAPYSVRARPGAPVSAPLTWAEVAAGTVRPTDFTLRTMVARLAAVGDLFVPALRFTQRLPDLPR